MTHVQLTSWGQLAGLLFHLSIHPTYAFHHQTNSYRLCGKIYTLIAVRPIVWKWEKITLLRPRSLVCIHHPWKEERVVEGRMEEEIECPFKGFRQVLPRTNDADIAFLRAFSFHRRASDRRLLLDERQFATCFVWKFSSGFSIMYIHTPKRRSSSQIIQQGPIRRANISQWPKVNLY